MGFLNKIINKSDKSTQNLPEVKSGSLKVSDTKEEKELTIAEIKEKSSEKSVKSSSTIKGNQNKKSDSTVIKTVKKDDTKDAYCVLIKPMITEKGTFLASQSKYLFEVSVDTNKIEIKKAIEALYGVTPLRINIVPMSGKNVRYGKTKGRTKNRKKAIVTLAKGQSIEVYEGV